jgi:autotransporter-associated beta strand protein
MRAEPARASTQGNVMADVIVNGTSGDDVLTVTATSSTAGTYSLNGGPAVSFSFVDGESFSFNGFAGNDTFTINNPMFFLFAPTGGINFDAGGDIGDTFNVLGGLGVLRFLTLTSSSTATLVNTGSEVQTINLSNLLTTSTITNTMESSGNTLVNIVGTGGKETFNLTDGGLVDGVATIRVGGPLNPDTRVAPSSHFVLDGGGGGDSVHFNLPNQLPLGFGIKNVGTVTQAAAIVSDTLVLQDVTGPVTLTGSNSVSALAAKLTGAGQGLTFNASGNLTVALGSVAPFPSEPQARADGVTTNNGDIVLTTEDGNLTIDFTTSAGSATASLTAGSSGAADRSFNVNQPVTATGGVAFTADNMAISAAVNAGGSTATLRPFQAGTLISLGGADGANTLGITDAELDNITAGVMVVGSDTAGRITLAGLVSPPNSGQLELVTGTDVFDANPGTDITVDRLGITAKTGIGPDIDRINIQVSNFEATTDTGGIFFGNDGLLTIGGVNGTLTGLRVTTSGDISGTSGDGIVLADSSGAETVFSASGDIFLASSLGDVVSTATGHAVIAAGGDITIQVGRDILLGTGGPGLDNDVRASGNVTLTATRHIVIDHDADIASDDFPGATSGSVSLTTTNGDVTIGTVLGTGASVSAAGGGSVQIVAGSAGSRLFTNRGSVSSDGGNVVVRADNMDLQAGSSIKATNGEVNLRVNSGGLGADLGSGAAGFNFTQAELDTLEADLLRITVSNFVHFSQIITLDPTRVTTLSLEANLNSVTESTAAETPVITVDALAIRTAFGIGSADDLDTAVSTLAFNNSNSGAVNITNAGALTIGAVDGLTTSFNAGTTNIAASSPLTFATTVVSAGTATFQAGEVDDDPAGADDLTINNFVVVNVTGGDLSLAAGDDVIIGIGTAMASGTVTVQAGANDLDEIGSVLSQGLIQGSAVNVTAAENIEVGRVTATGLADLKAVDGAVSDSNTSGADITATQLALRASTGVGIVSNPLETDVDKLEAVTATGGVFISNTGDLAIGGVDAGLSGVQVTTSGDIGFTVTGSLTLDGTSDEGIRTASGNVTIDASLDVSLQNGGADAIDSDAGNITILAGQDILVGTADRFGDMEASGDLTLNAGRDVIIDESSRLDVFGTGTISITAGRNISILATGGTTGARTTTQGGSTTLTTGTDGLLTLDSDPIAGTIRATGGVVTLNADRIDLTAGDSIRASTGTVAVRPVTAGRLIDLGSATDAAANTVEISDDELDRMITGTLVIGSDTSGALTVSAAISPAVVTTSFELRSGGTIAVNGAIDGGATAAVSLIGAGTITVTSNVTTAGGLSIETPGAATVNGIVSGSGGLTQNGAGTTTVNGTQSYTGATTINAGTLLVAGDIKASSGVSVGDDGTLGGNGTTGAVTVDGGTLSPGASAGTLTISGTLSFGLSGGTFLAEIGGQGAGLSDRVHVTGAGEVHLGNGIATLDASLIGGFDPDANTGAQIVIIDNDGTDAVTGTFDGLAEGAVLAIGGSSFSITYAGGSDNNDVVLTAINDPPEVVAALPDQVSQVNQAVSIAVPAGTFGDVDSASLTLTAALANGDPLPGTLTFDGNTITGKPPQNFIGDLEITITADDGTSSTTDTFILSVTNTGNDVLVSGTGTGSTGTGDIFPLVGGPGDDVYGVADEIAEVTEDAGGGTDTVYARVSYTMPDNVEGMVLQEAGGAIDGFGGDANDTIFGNSFTNTLTGGGGSDALIGGGGNDLLDGGAEADGMAGGTADDTYLVNDTFDQILENTGEGADTVYAGASFTLPDNVEGLVLVEGAGAIDGTGSAGNDTIIGNSASNVLDGRGGSDALSGGGGNDVLIGGSGVDGMAGGLRDDTYAVDDTFDQISEEAGEGADTVYASASFTLFANVEGLVLVEGAGAIDGTGNTDGNYIFGNGSDNTLHGGGGSDVVTGGAGTDTLHGDGGNDVLVGGDDDDVFVFGSGFGSDSIADFTAGDQIAFSQAVFANFAAVQVRMTEIDASTTAIVLDANHSLAVHHAPGATLTQNDFLFV